LTRGRIHKDLPVRVARLIAVQPVYLKGVR
jgi:hypothetical protein